MTLVIPAQFNKNSGFVRGMGAPDETGAWLIDYMCRRVGIADLGDSDVLDFGCGCRFAGSIVNRRLPVRSYTGIDVDFDMIDFLAGTVADPRFRFIWWGAHNPYYNAEGTPLGEYDALPVAGAGFDLICMFSVITHQLPDDAEAIFRLLRPHVRPGGRLFFSANIQEIEAGYAELVPETPAAHSAFSIDLMRRLLDRSGWTILSVAAKLPERPDGVVPIQDSLLCAPA